MREIKFRAYYKRKIRTVNFIDFKYWTIDVEVEGVATTTSLSVVDLMQYTGLKDKNWKEIYIGDIVKTEKNEIAEVLFDDYGVICFLSPDWQCVDVTELVAHSIIINKWGEKTVPWIEIIWNIYKNKDLLDSKNKE